MCSLRIAQFLLPDHCEIGGTRIKNPYFFNSKLVLNFNCCLCFCCYIWNRLFCIQNREVNCLQLTKVNAKFFI